MTTNRKGTKMKIYTDLKQIREILNSDDRFHNGKITQDDMYLLGNRLFINEKGKLKENDRLTVYEYPLTLDENFDFEPLDTAENPTDVPFKEYINKMVKNFNPDYAYSQLNLKGLAPSLLSSHYFTNSAK